MQERLKLILEESKKRLQEAASVEEAEEVRIKVLGKKGQLTEILRSMGKLAPEERKELGLAANQVRADIEKMLDATFEQLSRKAREAKFKAEKIDVTEPGKLYKLGEHLQLLRYSVILYLYVEVPAENSLEAACKRFCVLIPALQEQLRYVARKACGKAYESLMILLQQIIIYAGFVVEAVQVPHGDDLDEVRPADVVLAEENQVCILVTPRYLLLL